MSMTSLVQVIPVSRFNMPQGRARSGGVAGKVTAPQDVGFKCSNCNGEFASRHAMDCHRRHPSSIGTECANPRSSKSMSFTARADMSTGILRHHDAAIVGESQLTHTELFKFSGTLSDFQSANNSINRHIICIIGNNKK